MAARFDTWNGACDLEEKALHEESDYWTLSGYAATYDRDRVDDIIVPGAFKKCLERMHQKGENLQLYFNHDLNAPPIGNVVECGEDRKGLRYKAQLPKDDEFVAKRIVPQIKRRSLKSNSFGYKVREFERDKAKGVRYLKALDIFEISVVGIPANGSATIEGLKGFVPFGDLRIDRESKAWDASAAFKRLREHFKDDEDEIKQAFLYIDPAKSLGEWDTRFLIGDVDEKTDCVKANFMALMRTSAALYGSRQGDSLPEEVDEAVKSVLDRYYQRLDLESPAKSLSVSEWTVLDAGEREARLRGLGISQRLAKQLLFGQRDADRSPAPKMAPPQELTEFLTAMTSLAAAIKPSPQG